jgi:hypothetical protein
MRFQAMQSTPGEPAGNLYRKFDVDPPDPLLNPDAGGKGLFVHGGNPLYYTPSAAAAAATTTAEKTHAVLKQSPEDIGAHHVVLRVTSDPLTGERFMHIDRTPLAAIDLPAKGTATRSGYSSQWR